VMMVVMMAELLVGVMDATMVDQMVFAMVVL
jgi:hypothetical protein